MEKPLISIIVPCFNYSQYILECLESIKYQTSSNFECIIVDDGSSDDTEMIVKDWIKKDERFKYYYQSNSGVSKARNLGVALSRGKYILPIDADDKIESNYLEVCYKAMVADNDTILVYGESFLLNKPNKKWNLDPYNFEDLLYKNMIHCTALFKKRDFERVGGYDENMVDGLEDWEFWINLLKSGG